jgi:hypothetical protein
MSYPVTERLATSLACISAQTLLSQQAAVVGIGSLEDEGAVFYWPSCNSRLMNGMQVAF